MALPPTLPMPPTTMAMASQELLDTPLAPLTSPGPSRDSDLARGLLMPRLMLMLMLTTMVDMVMVDMVAMDMLATLTGLAMGLAFLTDTDTDTGEKKLSPFKFIEIKIETNLNTHVI